MKLLFIEKIYPCKILVKYFYFLILIIFSLFYYSCEQKHNDAQFIPKRYDCFIKINDKFGNCLIGKDKKYNPDSIIMIINGSKWTTHVDSTGVLWSYGGKDSLNNEKYMLYLSALDTDTIVMKVCRIKVGCFEPSIFYEDGLLDIYEYKIDTFRYNNRLLIPDTIDDQDRLIYSIVKL